ncbi:MAG: GIY-YIG nuclease family protein [Bacteroidota bacterium]
MRRYFVYIMSNKKRGTLYIGVTNSLKTRTWQHKSGMYDGFTKRYSLHDLIYFEEFTDVRDAITREKQLKKWNRGWKIELIEKMNPEWIDLYDTL